MIPDLDLDDDEDVDKGDDTAQERIDRRHKTAPRFTATSPLTMFQCIDKCHKTAARLALGARLLQPYYLQVLLEVLRGVH